MEGQAKRIVLLNGVLCAVCAIQYLQSPAWHAGKNVYRGQELTIFFHDLLIHQHYLIRSLVLSKSCARYNNLFPFFNLAETRDEFNVATIY